MEDWKPRKITDHYKQWPQGSRFDQTYTARMCYLRNIAGRIEHKDRSYTWVCD